jgi:hypothetical protein
MVYPPPPATFTSPPATTTTRLCDSRRTARASGVHLLDGAERGAVSTPMCSAGRRGRRGTPTVLLHMRIQHVERTPLGPPRTYA